MGVGGAELTLTPTRPRLSSHLRLPAHPETPAAGERTRGRPEIRHPARHQRGRQVGQHAGPRPRHAAQEAPHGLPRPSPQVQETRPDPAAPDRLCRAGEEGAGPAAAWRRRGELEVEPPGQRQRSRRRRPGLKKRGVVLLEQVQRIPLHTDRCLCRSAVVTATPVHAVAHRIFRGLSPAGLRVSDRQPGEQRKPPLWSELLFLYLRGKTKETKTRE